MWWLYSDHAYSSGCRVESVSSMGAAAARSCSTGGDASRGSLGTKRAATSAGVARSATTSTAGGSDVSEAAARRMVIPIPTSASMNGRSRGAGDGASALRVQRRMSRKLRPPSSSTAAISAILVSTITP